jgi:hypothetical protein
MILTRKEQRMLHAACIRKHLKALCFEAQGFWRACKPDGLCCWGVALLLASLVALACVFTGCSRKIEAPVSSFQPVEVHPQAWRGDSSYAAASPEWVAEFYANEFRPYLSKTLVNWDANFDCNKFASLFTAMAQISYAHAVFHKRNPPQALAIGEAWVQRKTGTHALVFIVTAEGEKFFEPQTGRFVAADGLVYFRKL